MKTKKLIDTVRQFYIDTEHRNSILMMQNDRRTVLYLKLFAESGRKRKVGIITKSTKTLKITRNREKHLFRKLSAYGFNDYVLRSGESFDKVWFKDNYEEWKIPVSFMLDKGQLGDKKGKPVDREQYFLHFKEQGFEVQLFIPLTDIEQFRIKKSENRRF